MVNLTTSPPDVSPVSLGRPISPSGSNNAANIAALGNTALTVFGAYLEDRKDRKLNELSIALTDTSHIDEEFNQRLIADDFDPLTDSERKDITETQVALRREALKIRQRANSRSGLNRTVSVLNQFKQRNPRMAIDADQLFSGVTGRTPGGAIRELETDPMADAVLDAQSAIAADNQQILDEYYGYTGRRTQNVEEAQTFIIDWRERLLAAEKDRISADKRAGTQSERQQAHSRYLMNHEFPLLWKATSEARKPLVEQALASADPSERLNAANQISIAHQQMLAHLHAKNIGGDQTAFENALAPYNQMVQLQIEMLTNESQKEMAQNSLQTLEALTEFEILNYKGSNGRTLAYNQAAMNIAMRMPNTEQRFSLTPTQASTVEQMELSMLATSTDEMVNQYLSNLVQEGREEMSYLRILETVANSAGAEGSGGFRPENLRNMLMVGGRVLEEFEPSLKMLEGTAKFLADSQTMEYIQDYQQKTGVDLLRPLRPVLDSYSRANALNLKETIDEELNTLLTESRLLFDISADGTEIRNFVEPEISETGIIHFNVKEDLSALRTRAKTSSITPGLSKEQQKQREDAFFSDFESQLRRSSHHLYLLYGESLQTLVNARRNIHPNEPADVSLKAVMDGKSVWASVPLPEKETTTE